MRVKQPSERSPWECLSLELRRALVSAACWHWGLYPNSNNVSTRPAACWEAYCRWARTVGPAGMLYHWQRYVRQRRGRVRPKIVLASEGKKEDNSPAGAVPVPTETSPP